MESLIVFVSMLLSAAVWAAYIRERFRRLRIEDSFEMQSVNFEKISTENQNFKRKIEQVKNAATPVVFKISNHGDTQDWRDANETNCIYTWAEISPLSSVLESL